MVMPLKLISSMATRELLTELSLQYQREFGLLVQVEAAGGVNVVKRVEEGEPVDVVVLSSAAIDKLIAAGHVIVGSRVDLANSGVAIAVRAAARKPDISTEQAVRAAVLASPSVSFSTGPSGVYLEKLFARWGILEQIRSRIIVPPPGTPVGSLIANGSVELGFQQLSELMTLPGIEVLGPLPAAIQVMTVFSGGIASASAQIPAARQLLQYLGSPAALVAKRRFGMESV